MTRTVGERPTAPRDRSPWVFVLALIASLLVHLAWTLWPVHSANEEITTPLAVSITELPPPPEPAAPAPKAKPKPKRHVAAIPRPAPPAPPPVIEPEPPAPTEQATEPTPPEAPKVAEAAPLDEPMPIAPAPEAPPPRELPPRIDLAYRAFLGTHGFLIGDAVYRLEHAANRYTISTVVEARGLVALFYHGQAKARSEGVITRAGLQPNVYSIERTSSARRESAMFDWESGMVQLNDEQAMPLDLPTFDPLVVLWQFYFAPPEQDEAHFSIATTRKIYHYAFHRSGTEKLKLPFGDVDTDVWTQDGGDGSITVQMWLAPSLHFVAAKVRVWNQRATVEALLDSIRIDDTVAQR